MNDNPYLNDLSRNDMTRSAPSGMSGFLLGAIVGAGVALLFAPAAGTDTRRRLGDTARKLGSAARDRIQEGREKTGELFESGKQAFEGAREGFQASRQGSERTEPNKGTEGQFGQGRREPVPSTGANPGGSVKPGTPGRP